MSQYSHRMSLVVPELLIPQANQLALIAGESLADVNTFTEADWQDADGNLYAVCSTVIKPIVLSMFGKPVADSVLVAEGSGISAAQKAMDAAVMYQQGTQATPDKIIIAIDIEPLLAFEMMGLSMLNDMDEIIPPQDAPL